MRTRIPHGRGFLYSRDGINISIKSLALGKVSGPNYLNPNAFDKLIACPFPPRALLTESA